MIVSAMVALNIFHPGRLLDDKLIVQEANNDSMTVILVSHPRSLSSIHSRCDQKGFY